MKDRITYQSLRKEWMDNTEEITLELRRSIRRAAGIFRDHFTDGFGSEPEYIMESMVGTLWSGLLSYCEDLCDTYLSLESMEHAFVGGGFSIESGETHIVIHLPNHDYGFQDREDGAYGGPQTGSGASTGGLCCMLSAEEFLKFLTVFDSLLPEYLEYIRANIQDARNYVKASEILISSANALIRPYARRMSERFDIGVSDAYPEKKGRDIELTFTTKGYENFRMMVMDVDYDRLIATPGEWIGLGCRSFDDPQLAADNECIHFINMDE